MTVDKKDWTTEEYDALMKQNEIDQEAAKKAELKEEMNALLRMSMDALNDTLTYMDEIKEDFYNKSAKLEWYHFQCLSKQGFTRNEAVRLMSKSVNMNLPK